jgi:hypothetical protein
LGKKDGSEAQELNLVNFSEMSRVSRSNSLGAIALLEAILANL